MHLKTRASLWIAAIAAIGVAAPGCGDTVTSAPPADVAVADRTDGSSTDGPSTDTATPDGSSTDGSTVDLSLIHI